MAKKGKEQQKQVASKHVTTRRLARWQQEKRRQRITFLSGIVIIVIVIGIIVGGVAATRSNDWLSKVQTDSGTITIKKSDYADQLKLFQVGIYNSSTMTNASPLSMLESKYLINDKTKEIGISVSETEIDNTILTSFGMANKSISDTDFKTQYNNMLSKYGISNSEFRTVIETSLLQEKLLNYYVNQTPTSGQQAEVEAILFYNESAANQTTLLWRGGETFTTLSEMYSSSSSSGWLIKGTMGEAFDNVAFSIDIGNISDPIPSATGYYVIKVMDRKDGPITDALRQQAGLADYNNWFSQDYKAKVQRNPKLNLTEVYSWAVNKLS